MKRMLILLGSSLFVTAGLSQEAPLLNNKLAATSTVMVAAGKPEVNITPNPVQGKEFNLELQSLLKGKYNIYLFDKNGKRYLVKVLHHEGGSYNQSLPLPRNVDEGVYILQVISKTARFSKKMIIE